MVAHNPLHRNYGTDLDSLLMGYLLSQPPERFSRVLNFLSTDIAAHYFAGRKSLSGAHSRDYGFWPGHGYLDHHLSILGCNPAPDSLTADTVSAVFLLQSEVLLGYQPDANIIGIASLPERSVSGRFGVETRASRTTPPVETISPT